MTSAIEAGRVAMLLALAERVEASAGADRELDVAILTAVLGYQDVIDDGSLFCRGNDGYWSLEGDEKNPPLPSPTGSLDAAMTLRLPGMRAYIVSGDAYSSCEITSGVGMRERVEASTIERPDEEVALCAVAAWLRARAAS